MIAWQDYGLLMGHTFCDSIIVIQIYPLFWETDRCAMITTMNRAMIFMAQEVYLFRSIWVFVVLDFLVPVWHMSICFHKILCNNVAVYFAISGNNGKSDFNANLLFLFNSGEKESYKIEHFLVGLIDWYGLAIFSVQDISLLTVDIGFWTNCQWHWLCCAKLCIVIVENVLHTSVPLSKW